MDQNFAVVHAHLGRAHLGKGLYEEAIAELRKAVTLSQGGALDTADLGLAYAKAGKRLEAMKIVDDLKEQSKRRYVSAHAIAEVYMGLGDRDRAFEWLEKAFEERSSS